MYHNNGYLMESSRDHHRGYSTEGEESHHAPSVRTVSEYALSHKHNNPMKPVPPGRSSSSRPKYEHVSEKRIHVTRSGQDSDFSRDSPPSIHTPIKVSRHESSPYDGSDLYVTGAPYRASSELSRGSRNSPAPSSRAAERAPSNYSGSARSGHSTVKTHTSRHGGVIVETMSTPNPFCPNTKGICCLMLLLNLGLILVTLGFVIVIQFFTPLVVWILGIVFLIFGFMTLIGSLLYCVHVFRNAKHPHDINPEDLYWTRYWQGHVGSAPEIHYKAEGKYADDAASDRFSKYSTNYSDRHSGHRY
ncbi:uncharacterized protein [Venturia canescens]|uniref:uncharacterized protein n=1 Tax=Venturia canescens TaxID=32260 RepID=UPI001C9C9297|nr:uncharacterized protein LOC122409749 [Venturia canescens]XP_043273459.1 uncharacterized protein LOC122409749 [Venturia canescens]